MPRGRTVSPYGLGERKKIAFERFSQGYTNVEVAAEIVVNEDTVRRYRREYEEKLETTVAENPRLLNDVLQNTVRMLEELDQVRRSAWDRLNEGRAIRCEGCGEEVVGPPGDQTRAQMLNTILKAQDQRAKLFGLFGVKTEYFVHVQNVQVVQLKMIEFMRKELDGESRAKLEEFLTNDLAEYMDNRLPIIDVEAIEAGAA